MSKTQKHNLAIAVGALVLSVCSPANAVLIYDNSVNDLVTRLTVNTAVVGDELSFAGTERLLKRFDFEYWVEGGDVQINAQLLLNDGVPYNGYPTPGTVLFDGGWTTVSPTLRSTLNFFAGTDLPVGGLLIPTDSLTLVVSFQGIDQGESAGVDLYDPPVVGTSSDDYWGKTLTGWELLQISGTPVNIASRFEATAVPDTTGSETLALAGLGIVGMGWYMRRKAQAA
jgi:hypothetical protein